MTTSLLSRRRALQHLACGFGSLALAGLAAEQQARAAAANPLAPKKPHHPVKAKRIIFLFMQGGVSHVDSFDYKPRLLADDGKMMEFDDARTIAKTGKGAASRVMKPLWEFRKRGQSGLWVSDLFPQMARYADELCV